MTKAIAEQFVRAANYAPWTDDYDFGGVDLSFSRFRSLDAKFDFPRPTRDPNREDSLMTVALRPHLIWGPRDQHLAPRLFERARAGKLTRVGDGTNRIATIYVENCATAHRMAADALVPGSSVPGSVYYISQEEPLNCWKWIDEILAIRGEAPVKKSVSFKTAWRLGVALEKIYRWAGWKSEPTMTRFLATQLAKSYWYDVSRAKRELGFTPAISTAEGMRRWAEELREEKK
jgi:nucleoside-diphosphate-sugar epimerase